jgi:uncharacterized YccA/Bax inhibitor family protein
MANPYLNDKAIDAAAANQAGWGAPDPTTRSTPITDGPVSAWHPGVMTVNGTLTATGALMALLLVSAAFGWSAVDTADPLNPKFPAMAMIGVVVGVICAIGVHFKPTLARILGPIYAIGEGFALGAISKGYENWQNGIVVQAVGATLGVTLVTFVLYRTNVIKVTDRFRRTVITATLGLMLFYLVSWVISLFGGSVSFLNSTSLLSIGFSILAAGLAAANLAIDFDFIEKSAKAGVPKYMEWYAAFALLVTLVWLYLELLRLLSKLNRR